MGTRKIIHNNLIYLLFVLAGRNIHWVYGHIFTHICAQEKSQLQVSIKLESLRSRVWYVTDKLMLRAEFNFSTFYHNYLCRDLRSL